MLLMISVTRICPDPPVVGNYDEGVDGPGDELRVEEAVQEDDTPRLAAVDMIWLTELPASPPAPVRLPVLPHVVHHNHHVARLWERS